MRPTANVFCLAGLLNGGLSIALFEVRFPDPWFLLCLPRSCGACWESELLVVPGKGVV